jgi:hypothetical protein
MNSRWQVAERRLLELLADRAPSDSRAARRRNFGSCQESVPDFDDECMEKAAATVQLAFVSVEPLPAAVHAKIRSFLDGSTESSR